MKPVYWNYSMSRFQREFLSQSVKETDFRFDSRSLWDQVSSTYLRHALSPVPYQLGSA